MKKIAFFAFAALLAACQTERVSDRPSGGEEFYATLETPVDADASADAKVFADENMKVLWNADDRIVIFKKNTLNQQYRFTGAEGSNSGGFAKVSGGQSTGPSAPLDYYYAIYPYDPDMSISKTGVVSVTLPARQVYKENSFGIGANTMVSVTSSTSLRFRNAGGYLAFKFYGNNVKVSSIQLEGRNHEKLAGSAQITMAESGSPSVAMQTGATESVTLVCEEPVAIGSSKTDYTEFWFVLPPTTFTKGFTVTVTTDDGGTFSKSVSSKFSVGRNSLMRMSALQVVPEGGMALNKTSLTLFEGESETLTVSGNDNQTVTWSTGNAKVATVDKNGKVTAVAAGSTTITATVGSQSAQCTVTVQKYLFSIDPGSVALEAAGGRFTVSVTASGGYHIDSTPGWVTETSVSDKVHTFEAQANTAEESRSGVIVFCDDRGTCLPCRLTQAAAEPAGFDWSQTFYHRSLMMRFTATWCGWCPMMAESVHLAQDQMPNKIEPLNLHASSSNLAFSGTETLFNQFLATSYPTGIVDARRKVANYSSDYAARMICQYVQETEQYYPLSSAIAYHSSWSGQQLSVDVTLYLRDAANYKVTVLLLESGIVGYQADNNDGSHSDYVHNNIARMALTGISGDAFTTTQAQTEKTFSYSVSVPTSYNKDNLRILVYVQRAFGSQTVLQDDNYGNYYVDNCASGAAGSTLPPTVYSSAGGGNESFENGEPINW